MKQSIGVVGLGAMGKAIAVNLLKAGFQTTVWNRSPEPVDELVSQGAAGAKHLGEVLKCDVVLSVLFNDAAVREVFWIAACSQPHHPERLMCACQRSQVRWLVNCWKHTAVAESPMLVHPCLAGRTWRRRRNLT